MEWISQHFRYLVIIFIFFLLYFTHRLRVSAMMISYQRQAAKRNGTIQKRFLSNPRLNLMDDGKTISIYEVAGGKHSPPHTNMKGELEIGGNVRIIVEREDVVTKIGKSLGLHDFHIGDPGFDDFFLIRGSDEFMVLTFLSPEIRDHILRLKDRSSRVRIEKNVFEFAVEGRLKEDGEYDQFIEAGLAILDKAKILRRGGETEVPASNNVVQKEAIQVTSGMYAESRKPKSMDYTALGVIGLILVAVIVAGYFALSSLDKGDKKNPVKAITHWVSNLQDSKNERLMKAARSGNVLTVQTLLTEGASPNTIDDNGWSVLISASMAGYADVVKLLLDNGAEVNLTRNKGITSLMMASWNGHADVVKILLDKGAEVDLKRTTDGITALWMAAQEGHADVVKLLLNKGAEVDIQRTTDGLTALVKASEKGNTEVVKLLLDNGAEVNAGFTDGTTALWQASYKGHADIIKLLLDKGAEVNVKERGTGATALIVASKNGHAEVVKLLLDNGAEADVKAIVNNVEWTALKIAKRMGHTDIVQLLEKAGAKD